MRRHTRIWRLGRGRDLQQHSTRSGRRNRNRCGIVCWRESPQRARRGASGPALEADTGAPANAPSASILTLNIMAKRSPRSGSWDPWMLMPHAAPQVGAVADSSARLKPCGNSGRDNRPHSKILRGWIVDSCGGGARRCGGRTRQRRPTCRAQCLAHRRRMAAGIAPTRRFSDVGGSPIAQRQVPHALEASASADR